MTNKGKIVLLREILDSVDLGNREDAITKYSSYLAIATTLEAKFLEVEKDQKWMRKARQDLGRSHSCFLSALVPEAENERPPSKDLESAKHYLVKVNPPD